MPLVEENYGVLSGRINFVKRVGRERAVLRMYVRVFRRDEETGRNVRSSIPISLLLIGRVLIQQATQVKKGTLVKLRYRLDAHTEANAKEDGQIKWVEEKIVTEFAVQEAAKTPQRNTDRTRYLTEVDVVEVDSGESEDDQFEDDNPTSASMESELSDRAQANQGVAVPDEPAQQSDKKSALNQWGLSG